MRPLTLRSLSLLAILLVALSCSRESKPPAQTGPIELTPPRLAPGQTIRTSVKTIAGGGRFSTSSSDTQSEGARSLERLRVVEKTIDAVADGVPTEFRIVVIDDTIMTTVRSNENNQSESVTSPLVGRPLIAAGEGGKWKLEFTTGESGPAEEEELISLEAFENRDWIPGKPVRPGDSWHYDPIYLRTLIERDLGATTTVGVMTLKSVETLDNGTIEARIDLSITSRSSEETDGESEGKASIKATGLLVIDLETMLEKKMTLEGTLTAAVSSQASQASATLPVRIELTREIVH